MFRLILTICIAMFTLPVLADSTLNVKTGVGGSTAQTGIDPVTFIVSGQEVTIQDNGDSVKYEIVSSGLKIGNIVVPSFQVVDDDGNTVVNVTHTAPEGQRAELVPVPTVSEQIALEGRVALPDEPQFTEEQNGYTYRRRGLFRRRR